MGNWIPYPRSFPNQCFRCGNNDPQHGPYLEIDSPPIYFDPKTKQPCRQYWCKGCLAADVLQDESPFSEIIQDQVTRETEILRMEIDEWKRKAEPVQAMVDEIRRQLGRDRQRQVQRTGAPTK